MATNDDIGTPTGTGSKKKLRVLLLPFFGTSHIQPFTELAISLAAANDAVEATVAVTPANVWVVESLLPKGVEVKVACYPFPSVEGLGAGVENSSSVSRGKGATAEEALRIVVAATDESLTRPAQEALIRAQCPDAIVTDLLFPWSSGIADELGVPCVAFNVVGAFPMLVIRELVAAGDGDGQLQVHQAAEMIAPTEVPEWLSKDDYSVVRRMNWLEAECFGMAMNTPFDLEEHHCEVYTRAGYVKRAYFVGPLPLLRSQDDETQQQQQQQQHDVMFRWLDSKHAEAERSVVYVSLGSSNEAHVKDGGQLDEIAAGLETSGVPFVWAVRGKEEWTPPAGWEERVKHRGILVRREVAGAGAGGAPSDPLVLGHPAVGAFVTHCGWKSMQATVAAGVPVLAWPSALLEHHITQMLLTEVLRVGEKLGTTTTANKEEDQVVVPAQDVARALTAFMRPGGPADAARSNIMELAPKVHAAVAHGGSSHRDLNRLVDDLLMAAAAAK
uniref:Uncharacterized protein n=1 Tax=Avena sativa TaxID=4498 RepID=A0ACD5TSF9_AVESA